MGTSMKSHHQNLPGVGIATFQRLIAQSLRSHLGLGFFRPYSYLCVGAVAALLTFPQIARADQGGVSFWIPGFFGSLAAVPSQAPGWSVTSIYYHDSVSAGADVARAREFQIRNLPFTFTGAASANINANVNLGIVAGTYTFATPVLGAPASASLLGAYGSNSTSLAGSFTGAI